MGKSALVTGASRKVGIGADVARMLAADGWEVFTTWWTPYDAERSWGSVASEPLDLLNEIGGHGIEADLEQVSSPAAIFDKAEAAVGPISALINVHTCDPGGGVFDIDAAALDKHYAINVRSTFLLCQQFARRYDRQARSPSIVNFLTGPPQNGSVAYATTKGAAYWMSLSLGAELAPLGIRVNMVDPGPNDTGWMGEALAAEIAAMSPLGRVGTPRDAASAVRFLVSPEGSWINGHFLRSDGGFSTLRS